VTGLCDAGARFCPGRGRSLRCGCQPTEVCVQLTPNGSPASTDERKLCAPCVADTDCPYPSDHCLGDQREACAAPNARSIRNCPHRLPLA